MEEEKENKLAKIVIKGHTFLLDLLFSCFFDNPNILKGLIGWVSSNCEFFQYCDSNIEFFFIAPPLVIALPTLR